MVRSNWKGTFIVALSWAGLAWGQSPVSPALAPVNRAPRTMVVQEYGKPEQKCRLLNRWKTADGGSAYEVQSIDTGELMTVVETGSAKGMPGAGAADRLQAREIRIFHWGRSTTPPPGAPLPPNSGDRAWTPSSPSAADSAEPNDWRKFWSNLEGQPSNPAAQADLPRANSQRPDPFDDPGSYTRRPLENLNPRGPLSSDYKTNDANSSPSTARISITPGAKPLGSQSVLAAGTATYVPVPIVTLPPGTQPRPPAARLPRPPQPAAAGGRSNTPGMMGNAFSSFDPNQPAAGGVMGSDPAAHNAFSLARTVPPQAGTSNPVPMAQGYPMPAGPGMYPPAGFRSVSGSGPMPRGMPPVQPYGPTVPGPQANGAGTPAHPGVFPAAYQQSGGQQPVPPAPVSRTAATGGHDIELLLIILRDSLYPSQREWAAQTLAATDGQVPPHVVHALLTAARQDPAATVRAGCIRCLARMNVRSQPVVTTFQALKMDGDPRVRQEADQALAGLALGQETENRSQESGIRNQESGVRGQESGVRN